MKHLLPPTRTSDGAVTPFTQTGEEGVCPGRFPGTDESANQGERMPATPINDYFYATFVEVCCPDCGETTLEQSKSDARRWASDHRTTNHK